MYIFFLLVSPYISDFPPGIVALQSEDMHFKKMDLQLYSLKTCIKKKKKKQLYWDIIYTSYNSPI